MRRRFTSTRSRSASSRFTRPPRGVHRPLGIAVAALVLLSGLTALSRPAPASALPTSLQRTEEVYRTSETADQVIASVVRHRVPLSRKVGPHPAACDWVSYLRFRSASGPSSPELADRILVAQPGIMEGAGAFEPVARNTVAAAAARGDHIEFWALDRRSNCLEDHTGLLAGVEQGSVQPAIDYYFHGKPVHGKTFDGFTDVVQNATEHAWLRHIGLRQTLDDQYAIMAAEIPDQRLRKQKMLCGGHSLGGFITGYFAEWDFDGDPRTRADAGYNQCAGYFALDTAVTTDMVNVFGRTLGLPAPLEQLLAMPDMPGEIGWAIDELAALPESLVPAMALPLILNAEMMNLLAVVALAAVVDPDGVDGVLPYLPRNLSVDAALRILLSQDYAVAATGRPDVRTLRATNAALLGMILDDNFMPVGFIQAGFGMIAPGAPVAPRSFPLPDQLAEAIPLSAMIFGDGKKFAPSAIDGRTVYRWADYDEIGPALRGTTTPAREVTALKDLARSLSEPPLDFTEWYFPTGMMMDLTNRAGPDQARHRRYPDAALRAPMITFSAAGGLGMPNPAGHGTLIRLDGYSHVDVVAAAAQQNDGRPEQVSTRLAEFAVTPR